MSRETKPYAPCAAWVLRNFAELAESDAAGQIPVMNFDYAEYLERRADVCGGALVVKGTRVLVRTLLASLAEGAIEAEVRRDFPTVTPDGLRAVIAFAAAAAGDDLPVSPLPAVAV